MEKLLLWFSGKKGATASILMGVIAYLGTKDILGTPEVTLAALICVVLFGTASHQTAKLFIK